MFRLFSETASAGEALEDDIIRCEFSHALTMNEREYPKSVVEEGNL